MASLQVSSTCIVISESRPTSRATAEQTPSTSTAKSGPLPSYSGIVKVSNLALIPKKVFKESIKKTNSKETTIRNLNCYCSEGDAKTEKQAKTEQKGEDDSESCVEIDLSEGSYLDLSKIAQYHTPPVAKEVLCIVCDEFGKNNFGIVALDVRHELMQLVLLGELLRLMSALLVVPEGENCKCNPKKPCTGSETPPSKNRCPCPRGGVVSNTSESAEVGREILDRGGSAVDAAIATLFCEGVLLPHTTGIGGSFLMTIYDYESRIVKTLNARGSAPAATTANMFEENISLSEKGGLSVCVPGQVRGCWYAHRDYGRLPWADLIKPACCLAKCGFQVTPYMDSIFFKEQKQIQADDGLRELYVDPNTKNPYAIGETIKNLKLGKTLSVIAERGETALYDGELTESFVNDIKSINGIITVDDLNNYKPLWGVPLSTTLPDDRLLYTMDSPGSGSILILILNILNGSLDLQNIDSISNWHNILESFKFGFGIRPGLGDSVFEKTASQLVDTITSKTYATSKRDEITQYTYQDPEHYGATALNTIDHGATNIVVLAPEGDAVVVTSTLSQNFGAGTLSKSTGIILNDEMSDFSIPNQHNSYGLPLSSTNFSAPGKRPFSSMAPTIILDKNGDVVLGIGGAGGSTATTGTALVTLRHLFFKEPLTKAVASKRILHQLFPMHALAEYGFSEKLLKGLIRRGHEINIKIPDGFAAVTVMAKTGKCVTGSFDPRRGGAVEFVY
ncbi:hypothetical protein RN001_013628 [Aquatica leii]|uniref:Gamma-glutamyltranspeptidase 1 n=1 Tax=Aquatica leii TaxID=1421715 RepID=A0AAN7P327_9COLE|nr:hypothetical protein RN001_013628 [Aquatica leii]